MPPSPVASVPARPRTTSRITSRTASRTTVGGLSAAALLLLAPALAGCGSAAPTAAPLPAVATSSSSSTTATGTPTTATPSPSTTAKPTTPTPTAPPATTARATPVAPASTRASRAQSPGRAAPSPARTTPAPVRTTPPPAPPPPAPAPPPPAPAPPPPPAGDTGAYEARMIALINGQRAAAGLGAVSAQACPDGYAEPWSPRMASAVALSHQSIGSILSGCGARTAAENVGMTSDQTPDAMMALFMGSAGHRANILNPALTGVGVGAYRDARGVWWVTQDFVG